eukprot:2358260-Pyramimonas_sp.AAC.1
MRDLIGYTCHPCMPRVEDMWQHERGCDPDYDSDADWQSWRRRNKRRRMSEQAWSINDRPISSPR